MTTTLLIDLFSEQSFFISNLCTFFGTPSISAGSMSRSLDHVFRDVIPQRVVIGMVDNDAFNDAFRKNPFNFQNYKMTLCGLLKIMNPFQTDFIKPIFQQKEVGSTLQRSILY